MSSLNNYFTFKTLQGLSQDKLKEDRKCGNKIYTSSSYEESFLLKLVSWGPVTKIKNIGHEIEVPDLFCIKRPARLDYVLYRGVNNTPINIEISPAFTHDSGQNANDKRKFKYFKQRGGYYIILKFDDVDAQQFFDNLTYSKFREAMDLIDQNHLPVFIGWNGNAITLKQYKNYIS